MRPFGTPKLYKNALFLYIYLFIYLYVLKALFFLKRQQFRRFSGNEHEPIYRKQIACMPHMLADAWHEAQQVARGMSETSPSHSQKSKLIPSVGQKHYEDVPFRLTAGQT